MSPTDLSATLDLTCELIRRESVTPEDAGCQDVMVARLAKLGFQVTPLPFDDVQNFWAVRGESGPILCFAGHTDVVPPGNIDHWQTPPFEPTIKEGILYGRGAADMKGSLAAMVVAVENFLAECPDHKGRIAFLITSDEEGIAVNGTVKVVEWLEREGCIPQWCLVGEPSSSTVVGDVIKNGRRGSLGGVLRIRGIQGHVAYPHLADNPIHKAFPALNALANEQWDNGNKFFPATSFQISNIQAGTGATNVIPGELTATFNFRYSTETDHQQLQARVENLLDEHQIDYHIDWSLSGKPFLTSEGELVDAAVSAIKNVTRIDTQLSTAGGTSDGRFIAPLGTQVVELGPVNATIHKVNEQVSVAQLDTLQQIYVEILRKLLT